MAVRIGRISTGVEIVDGLPGSGKSYYLVKEIIKSVLVERRPVYTNLPLRMKALRRYLAIKGGPKAARYVKKLNPSHWHRFLKRNSALQKFWSEQSQERFDETSGEFVRTKSFKQIQREFNDIHGEPKTNGPDADWFEIGAKFYLDEWHREHDQRRQDFDGPELQDYLTMQRHHVHNVIAATQDKMQLSLPWRRNCIRFVHAVDKRRIPIFWFVKVPIPLFHYEEFNGDLEKSGLIQKPTSHWSEIPWLDGGVVWRLYSSFTHVGGARKLKAAIEETRRKIEGADLHAGEKVMPKSKLRYAWPTIACGLAGFIIYDHYGPKPAKADETPTVQKKQEVTAIEKAKQYQQKRQLESNSTIPEAPKLLPTTQASSTTLPAETVEKAPSATPVIPPPPPPPTFNSRISALGEADGLKFAVVDGRIVHLGSTINDWMLVNLEVTLGQTTWQTRDFRIIVDLNGGVHPAVTNNPERSAAQNPTTQPTVRDALEKLGITRPDSGPGNPIFRNSHGTGPEEGNPHSPGR